MAHKGLSGQTLLLWESWVCTVQKRNHVVPCHCMLVLFPTCIWKLAFDIFQLLLRETVSRGGWGIHWVYSKKAKKVQYPVKVHMVQAKFNMHTGVHPSKDPTNMQLCADKWRVAQLLSCNYAIQGVTETGLEYDGLNSPSLTFLFLYYIIYIIYTVLFYSQILDKCDHPKLSKTLGLPALQISGHHVNLEFLSLNSLFPKTVTKYFKKPFQGWSQTTNISNQSKKNAKTFNACLTACWMSFSTETQQHRSTCHFFRMPPQDWNMTYLHVFAKEIQPQIAMGLQIVICSLKFGQSWQVLSSCVKTGQHAEQRLTLSSDEIENH